MSNLYWLSEAQTQHLRSFFPKSHGKPRVADQRGPSGIIFINRKGLRWCDASRECGRSKTLYTRRKRRSERGVFARIMAGLVAERAEHKTSMIPAHRVLRNHLPGNGRDLFETAPHSLEPAGQKGGRCRQIGRTKGGLNTELHATPSRGLRANHCRAVDARGRPIRVFLSAGQVGDDTGAAALPDGLPKADWLWGDRGYDADWLRDALKDKRIKVCLPGRKSRKTTVNHDKRRYKRRTRIEIMSGRLKDWRRVATRYDRCPETLLSATALAATILVWL